MIILINGSFGVGKTTVGRLLRKAMPGSVLYDPEWAGMVLMRMPGRIGLQGSGTDDFQDLALWRRSVPAGIRLFKLAASGPVIVPMTFTRRDYFDQVVAGIKEFDDDVKVFCLTASLATVKQRLRSRGDNTEGPGSEWRARRIIECEAAHRDPHFGEPIDTENRTAPEVVQHIIESIKEKHTPD